MKIKALIQNHFPERIPNIQRMVDDLVSNGLDPHDIIVMVDHDESFKTDALMMRSEHDMPINWWHGVAAVLDCDYVALLCDDLTLKLKSIEVLKYAAMDHPEIDIFGFEGGKYWNSVNPYTDSRSHTVMDFELADFVIRFYFGKPKAFRAALDVLDHTPKHLHGHDDLILCLSNECGLVPTTQSSGWIDLDESGTGVSKKPDHYQKRNELGRIALKLKGSDV